MTTPTTYATLKTALAAWSHRDDLTDSWAEIIAMAEARMNDELLLKDYESDEALTLTANQNYVALPTGYVSPIAFWIVVDTQRIPMIQVLPQDLPYYTDATIPKYWAIDGVNIRFDCPVDSAYSAYLRMVKVSNLSDSNTTNYLLTKRPDVYMAACMSEFSRYVQDAQVFSAWEPKYVKGAAALKAAENRSRQVMLRTDIGVGARSNIFRGD